MNGKKLKETINEKGITAYRLAKETDMRRSTLSRILSGEQKDVMLSTAFKLADALGVDVDEFRKED